ncbi:MAG: BREX-1 system phosphatase PglZ type A, partial [Defluviitaleaceae bacterium]|nr:BREX-1 system phosphatase PglZ type A [Defluviitaleaceae bacterium]
MNLTEVKKSLDQQFARPLAQGSKRNIIFWYDENGEFADVVDNLDLENAQTIKLYNNNMFATKLHIEETDRENNLLVYSPLPRPDNRDNWLTDTIKYSQTFSTDITSIHLLNFGIDNALRSVVDKYKVFFGEKNRSERFASYALAPYTEYRIDLGVLSSLCKLKAPNIDNVVRTLLTEMVHGEKTIYESIIKFGNMDTFWLLMKEYFGYTFEEQSLEKLAIFLLCSHLSRSIAVEMPKDWQAYVSDNSNCLVFVDEFMKNSQHWENYNQLAVLVAEKLGLSSHADKWLISD